MGYDIGDPFTFTESDLDHLIYEVQVEGVDFYAIFASTAEALDPDEVKIIQDETGVTLSNEAVTFKFDRCENFHNNTFYSKPLKRLLTPRGMTALGNAIATCFELHQLRSGTKEYYAFAVDKKLARFYTSLAKRHSTSLGFEAYTQVGSDNMAFVFRKNEV